MRRARSIGTGGDASRTVAPPVSKRQRTVVEHFQSLSISQQSGDTNTTVPDTSNNLVETQGSASSLTDDEAMSSEDEQTTIEKESTRKIMYQLALGKSPYDARPKDPVDAKLEEMIRRTRLQLAQPRAKDDFDFSYDTSSCAMEEENIPERRPRSNSLPRDWTGSEEEETSMDIDRMM